MNCKKRIYLIYFNTFCILIFIVFNPISTFAQNFLGFAIGEEDSFKVHYSSAKNKVEYNNQLICIYSSHKITYGKPLKSIAFDSAHYYNYYPLPDNMKFDSTLLIQILTGSDTNQLIMAFQIPDLIEKYKFEKLFFNDFNKVNNYLKTIIDHDKLKCLNKLNGLSGFILEIYQENKKITLYDVNVSTLCIPETTRFVFFVENGKIINFNKVY